MTMYALMCEQKKTSLKQNIVNNNTLIKLELPLARFLSGRCTPELLLVRAFQILNQNIITMVMAYVLEGRDEHAPRFNGATHSPCRYYCATSMPVAVES